MKSRSPCPPICNLLSTLVVFHTVTCPAKLFILYQSCVGMMSNFTNGKTGNGNSSEYIKFSNCQIVESLLKTQRHCNSNDIETSAPMTTVDIDRNILPCLLCPKSYTSQNSLKRHTKLKHAQLSDHFKCKICDIGFQTRHELDLHRQQEHRETKLTISGTCSICLMTLSSLVMLRTHVKQKHTRIVQLCPFGGTGTEHKCPLCSTKVKNPNGLNKHLRNVHFPLEKEKPPIVECKVCHKQFIDKLSWRKHLITHSEGWPFKCSVCNSVFEQKRGLDRHMIVEHRTNPVQNQELVEREFKCSICNSVFEQKRGLDRHMVFGHLPNPVENQEQELVEREFKCSICSSVFEQKRGLDRHMVVEHQPKPLEKQEHKCEFCHQQFFDEGSWIHHLKKTHNEFTPFKCSSCYAQFQHRSNLKSHSLRTHRHRIRKHPAPASRIESTKTIPPNVSGSGQEFTSNRDFEEIKIKMENADEPDIDIKFTLSEYLDNSLLGPPHSDAHSHIELKIIPIESIIGTGTGL